MMNFSRIKISLPVLGILVTVCSPTIARAGFEWSPPAQQPRLQKQSPLPLTPEMAEPEIAKDDAWSNMQPLPPPPVEKEFLAPELLEKSPDVASESADLPAFEETAPATQRLRLKPTRSIIAPYGEAEEPQVYYKGELLRRHKPDAEFREVINIEVVPPPAITSPYKNTGFPADTFFQPPVPEDNPGYRLIDDTAKTGKTETAIKPLYGEISGFGKDMPLALALRQIVPPEYQYAFADGVNPGTRISWQGGRPWDEVLSAALSPAGYTPSIREGRVTIRVAE